MSGKTPNDQTESTEFGSTHNNQSTKELEGELGDAHRYTPKIRQYANEVVNGDEWPIEVDLNRITFETREQARGRHGVTVSEFNEVRIGISEHTIDNAGFESVKSTIRHELIHAWQRQFSDADEKTLPDGTTVSEIESGHSDESWDVWSTLLDVERTHNHYTKSLSDYRYAVKCPVCGASLGKHRLL